MRILVTGATGFIGGHLVKALAPAHEVWGLVRRPPTDVDKNDGVTWIVHDISRPEPPDGLPAALDAVVHTAQSRHYRDFPEHTDDVVGVNIRGTLVALEWARALRATRFVHLSTGGIGGASPRPITEDVTPDPSGPLAFYLATKAGAEQIVRAYAAFFVPIVLRPFFVYGPGQDPGMLIPRLIDRVRDGKAIAFHPPDGIRINPVYVDDTVAAIEKALQLDAPAVVNVAGPDVLTIGEIARTIGAALKIEPRLEMASDLPSGDLIGETRTMAALLGPPRVGFKDGLAWLGDGVSPVAREARS